MSNDPNTPAEQLASLARQHLAEKRALETENQKLRNLLHGAIVTVGDYMPKNLLKQIKQALAKESDDDEK